MKVSIVDESYQALQKQWYEAMRRSAGPVQLGNNPSLTEIIHLTWKWPWITAGFYSDDRLVALASAVKIRTKYVSLPHFDHGSLWLDYKHLSLIAKIEDQDAEYRLHRFFYHRFIDLPEQMPKLEGSGTFFRIDISAQELQQGLESNEKNKGTDFMIRSRFRLSPHYLDDKVIPYLLLEKSMPEQMDRFSGNLRRKIRKAEKNGIETIVGRSELLDDFYRVYCKNISQLSSFALPKRFFLNLLTQYKNGNVYLVLARYKEMVIGASILMSYLDFAENGWFASVNTFNALYVSYALHHQMISLSIEQGCAMYSFGRSTKNSSVHDYKRQWGTMDQPLYLNDTKKQPLGIHHFSRVRQILKHIPSPLLRPWDGVVSRFVY